MKWVSNLQGGVVPQEEHFLHSTGIFPVALRRFRAVTASRAVATRRYKFRRGKTRLVTRFTKPLAAFFPERTYHHHHIDIGFIVISMIGNEAKPIDMFHSGSEAIT